MTSETVQAACDKLIDRVRYETASLRLPVIRRGNAHGDDTKAIQAATRLYTETWIVPVLRAIRDNDLDFIRQMTK